MTPVPMVRVRFFRVGVTFDGDDFAGRASDSSAGYRTAAAHARRYRHFGRLRHNVGAVRVEVWRRRRRLRRGQLRAYVRGTR